MRRLLPGALLLCLVTSGLAALSPALAVANPPMAQVHSVDLTHDFHPATQSGLHRGDRTLRADYPVRWPARKITVHETLPAKWQWGFDQAIKHWNALGSKVRFKVVKKRSRAKVTVGYGQTYGSDGYGGWTARGHRIFKGFVHISPIYKKVDHRDDDQRIWMGLLIAHELGHVLGFEHDPQTKKHACSLMQPIFYFGDCGPQSQDRMGYYRCRWIDKGLAKRFKKKYGGKAKAFPEECPTYPVPSKLEGVSVSGGGAEAPVLITWNAYGDPRAKSIRITVSNGDGCDTSSDVSRTIDLPRSATSWQDPHVGAGPACYRVLAVNRSGAGVGEVAEVREQHAYLPSLTASLTEVIAQDGYSVVRFEVSPTDGSYQREVAIVEGPCTPAGPDEGEFYEDYGDAAPEHEVVTVGVHCAYWRVGYSSQRGPAVAVQFETTHG